VTLAGCAPSHPGVATTIVRLRKLHNVVDVTLSTSVKADKTAGSVATGCPVTWAGTATFRPESAPTAPAPVPARLGGGQ
jgi:hypothetical protein